MGVESFLALKYLTRKQRVGFISLISWISVLGMAVGVMALIVVLAVMSGFDTELKDKIVGMQPHVTVTEAAGLRKVAEVMSRIVAAGVPDLISMAPYVEGQAIIRSNTNATGLVVKGLDEMHESLGSIKQYLTAGSWELKKPYVIGEKNFPRILIGQTLAWILQVHMGDQVDVISPHIERRGLLPPKATTRTFVVSGIYAFGMNDFDASLALIDVREAQVLYHLVSEENPEGAVTGLGLRIKDVDLSERLRDQLQQLLGQSYLVGTWVDRNRNFFAALRVEKTVMTIILSLITLVAAFNIVASLIMLVLDKTKDIGILRALGMSAERIKNIFLLEGMFIGLFGTLIGAASGVLLALNLNPLAALLKETTGIEVFPSDIYYFSRIPAEIQPTDVAVIVGCAFFLTLLAAWYPARHASRLVPVEALRYE